MLEQFLNIPFISVQPKDIGDICKYSFEQSSLAHLACSHDDDGLTGAQLCFNDVFQRSFDDRLHEG